MSLEDLEKELKVYDEIVPKDNYEKGLKDANRTRLKDLIKQKRFILKALFYFKNKILNPNTKSQSFIEISNFEYHLNKLINEIR